MHNMTQNQERFINQLCLEQPARYADAKVSANIRGEVTTFDQASKLIADFVAFQQYGLR